MVTKFDLVVFGASGYAGKYVVEHLANKKSAIEDLSWAVAGRSVDKLRSMLAEVGGWVDRDLSNIECLEANIDDEKSLNEMCSRARCLLNCVGPYTLYGEPVVKAAIANKCHHVDLSGEELFIKNMMLKYGEEAKKAKVFVISACGFDSAISDMGISYLIQNCPNLLNGICVYMVPHMASFEVNIGTWNSAIAASSDWRRKGPVDKLLFPKQLPSYDYKLGAKFISYKQDKYMNNWAFWYPMGDVVIASMSQYHRYAEKNKWPVQIEHFFCAERNIQILGGALTLLNIGFFTLTNWGKNLLRNYPELFSFGVFRKTGPNRKDLLDRKFEMIFEGQAFDAPKDYYEVNKEAPKSLPNKLFTCRVSGPDPAYITCATAMAQAGVVLLKEREKLPENGGVSTPAVVFDDSSYIDRLQKHDLKFEMLD